MKEEGEEEEEEEEEEKGIPLVVVEVAVVVRVLEFLPVVVVEANNSSSRRLPLEERTPYPPLTHQVVVAVIIVDPSKLCKQKEAKNPNGKPKYCDSARQNTGVYFFLSLQESSMTRPWSYSFIHFSLLFTIAFFL